MAINRVELNDFLVFKGGFAADFCPGVNVLIGGNGTGKTTLLRHLYHIVARTPHYFSNNTTYGELNKLTHAQLGKFKHGELSGNSPDINSVKFDNNEIVSSVFIPEKDILEHAKGLLPFIEQKQTGFSQIYKDVLVRAQDIPTQNQSETQKNIGEQIIKTIGGYVLWDQSEGSFYTVRTDGLRIPFSNEASGFKKLGFLGLLVTSGQLEKGSVLFWDEPENSLNPELVPILVDILLELSWSGVQIFLATHSEIFASYFSVNKQIRDRVMFYSLYKDGDQIKINSSVRFDLLNPNKLTAEPVKLYEKEISKKGLGNND